MITPQLFRRIYRASAWYDLCVTWVFATPVTLALFWPLLQGINAAMGAPAPTPDLGVYAMLFGNFFGTVVVIWSLVRLRLDLPALGRADAVGRVAFSLWMITALANGAGPVLWLFLTFEICWAAVQLLPVRVPAAAE